MTSDRARLSDFTENKIPEKKAIDIYVNTNKKDVWGMGVVAVEEGDGENIHKTAKTLEESEYVDRTTHNVVEYEAVIYSLEYIKKEYDENHAVFNIYTNSETVIGEPQDDKMATLSRHMNRSRGGIYTNISHIREGEPAHMQTANELAREAAKGASGVE